ncbi:MAG: hypothetical protein QM598_04200 [Protaetiibacter sp.]
MTHEPIRAMLEAQRANALLGGASLRRAATNLVAVAGSGRRVVLAFDHAGERVIGAAMLTGGSIETFDYTQAFPDGVEALLVGGYIAGPVDLEAAAEAAVRAGATRVIAAMLSEWSTTVANVDTLVNLNRLEARVA